jgi:MoaA/NifB/PqqE/SkfB family radical SAM enzyme
MNVFSAPSQLGKLTIEVTTQCNLKCAGCPRTIGIANGTWSNIHLDLGLFERIVAGLPRTEFVTLHGIGEPTLHPQFVEVVQIAKRSGKFGRMKVTTNGLARTIDHYAAALEAGLDEFWISVDSFDPGIAERMRSGTLVTKLEERVRECMERKLPLHISLVVSAINYRDVPATLRRLHALGAPPVHMQEFQDYGDPYGLMTLEMRQEFLALMRETLPTLSGMAISPPNFTRPKGKICMAPWLRPAISVQGYLTPCCTTFDPALFDYTNLGEMTFAEAWRRPGVLRWIAGHLRDNQPICVGCGLNPRAFGLDGALGRSGKVGTEQHVVQVA